MTRDINELEAQAAGGRTRRPLTWALLLAAGVGIAAPALARPQAEETTTRKVAYADLNLSTPRGVAVLDQRIAAAVRQVCGSVDPREQERHAAVLKCRQDARARIEPEREAAIARVQSRMRLASAR